MRGSFRIIWRSRAGGLVCKLFHEIRIDLEGPRYFARGMLQGWRWAPQQIAVASIRCGERNTPCDDPWWIRHRRTKPCDEAKMLWDERDNDSFPGDKHISFLSSISSSGFVAGLLLSISKIWNNSRLSLRIFEI